MNRSKMILTVMAAAFVLSMTTVSFAAEKKSGYFGMGKNEAKAAATTTNTATALRGANTLLGKGDPKKFAAAMKAVKGVNPRTLNTARQLGANPAMKTLTANPNSLKAITAMAKSKAAAQSR